MGLACDERISSFFFCASEAVATEGCFALDHRALTVSEERSPGKTDKDFSPDGAAKIEKVVVPAGGRPFSSDANMPKKIAQRYRLGIDDRAAF